MCKLEEPLKSHPGSFLFFSLQDNMDLGDEDEDDEKVRSHVLYVAAIYLSACLLFISKAAEEESISYKYNIVFF